MDRHHYGAALLGIFMLAWGVWGCDPGCPSGQRYVKVRAGDGYVCLDDDDSDVGSQPAPSSSYPMPPAPPTSTTTPPPPSSSSVPPAATCETLAAPSTADVVVVVKSGSPEQTDLEVAPPDGDYVLAQASAYPSDPSGSPLEKVRASLSVSNAKIVFGGQATVDGSVEPNESFTFTLATSSIVKICETRSGSLSSLWFPGAEGVKRPAQIVWDGTSRIFRLVVATPFGEVELLFSKK